MRKPAKNILIYADGRVREMTYPLEGRYFIEPVTLPNGDLWRRTFDVTWAHSGPNPKGGPDQEPTHFSMVALECDFQFLKSAADIAREDAERRAETMKKALWGIANYPGGEATDDSGKDAK